MTVVRLGYVAMSMQLKNCSPSQTMTFKRFAQTEDRNAAIRKLEGIARSNLENCLRLLRHNLAHDIRFFRFSSRLIPLATHEELKGWDYMQALKDSFQRIGDFLKEHPMRIDFHPDHFVLLNTKKIDTFNISLKTLALHEAMLQAMDIDPEHRCVLHVGGGYGDKEKSLEQFVQNWGNVPSSIQQMIILENDDKVFSMKDTLYLCEKLGIPFVFDYHHHLVNHENEHWLEDWERAIQTWKHSKLPMKIHISSPRSEKDVRAHADYIDPDMFLTFLHAISGTVEEIHCMIEAKKKDEALFQLVENLKKNEDIEMIDGASFII